jgi:hypothetical protein
MYFISEQRFLSCIHLKAIQRINTHINMFKFSCDIFLLCCVSEYRYGRYVEVYIYVCVCVCVCVCVYIYIYIYIYSV